MIDRRHRKEAFEKNKLEKLKLVNAYGRETYAERKVLTQLKNQLK